VIIDQDASELQRAPVKFIDGFNKYLPSIGDTFPFSQSCSLRCFDERVNELTFCLFALVFSFWPSFKICIYLLSSPVIYYFQLASIEIKQPNYYYY
jgi:hypothetical protein